MALTWDAIGKRATAVIGDSDGKATASLVIGGSTPDKFVPNINMSKWSDECWLNFNSAFAVVHNEQPVVTGGLVELTIGRMTHRYYVDTNNHLEYEIEFERDPGVYSIAFALHHSGNFDFFYQGEMTDEEAQAYMDAYQEAADLPPAPTTLLEAKRMMRPANVLGSYAVYLKNKAHNDYKTGKFCHIYRPRLTDALGAESWATLSIVGNTLTISIR